MAKKQQNLADYTEVEIDLNLFGTEYLLNTDFFEWDLYYSSILRREIELHFGQNQIF